MSCLRCDGRTADDINLCNPCLNLADLALAQICANHGALRAMLAGEKRAGSAGLKSRPPISCGALDMQEAVKATLVSWAADWADATRTPVACEDTIPHLTRWMREHLDYYQRHIAAEEWWSEITTASGKLARYVSLDKPRKIRLRACPVGGSEWHCIGTVNTYVAYDSALPLVAVCDYCGAEWGADQLELLAAA